MKRLFALSVCTVLIGVFAPWLVATAFAVESIDRYEVDLALREDSSLQAKETIDYDFGTNERHGIFRFIPLTHRQSLPWWYKNRIIAVEDIKVAIDGQPATAAIKQEGGMVEIKIGDPNQTITGRHRYEISYTARGTLSTYEHAPPEVYWNATGNEWTVPIKRVSVALNGPPSAFVGPVACYEGVAGSNERCTVEQTQNGYQFTAQNLRGREGVTIAAAVDPAVVAPQVLTRANKLLLFALVFMFGAVSLLLLWHRVRTVHDPNQPIIPQYEPYAGVLPMYTGVLQDGRLDPKDITAGILYLAQSGYIKIRKIEKKVLYFFEVDDYEIEVVKPFGDINNFLKTVGSLLFDNPQRGDVVRLSALKGNRRKNARTLRSLHLAVRKDLIKQGFYEKLFHLPSLGHLIATLKSLAITVSVFIIALYLTEFLSYELRSYILFALPVITVVGVFLYSARRPTAKGYKAINHIRGFKDFLSTTGKDRFKFHNAPSKNPEQFLEYLPYAVALGVEKEWADVFKDITVPQPDWYEGSAAGYFSATALTSDLSAFSSSFSSSSGASGGGSSGGGSGGGGGGSW